MLNHFYFKDSISKKQRIPKYSKKISIFLLKKNFFEITIFDNFNISRNNIRDVLPRYYDTPGLHKAQAKKMIVSD